MKSVPGSRDGRARRAAATVALWAVSIGAVGCSSATGPDVKPTRAEIRVEGTAPVPLRLVVSTDFFEVFDAGSGQTVQRFINADTTFVTLPYASTVTLGDLGSVVVALTNPDDAPAQVRMRVDLDSGQSGYDQSATMSEGGTLRYVFRFLSRSS